MQQINLYQPIFRRQKKIFSAVTMLQIVGFFIVILGALYAYATFGLQPFRGELLKTEADFAKLTKQIELYRAKYSEEGKSKLLETEIARLTRELAERRRLKETLAAGSFGNIQGFSSLFEALAKGHVDGAWLTGIRIGKGGHVISLSGKTVDPELIPVYIRRLSDTAAFRNRGFNVLDLARSEEEEEAGLINFNIATETQG
ncbi:MAG: hypothetical protein HYY48_09240 [Gammaproteobacteria bacterium]|nr:hypothetical protein [Gammaproteobacteria bacterium]